MGKKYDFDYIIIGSGPAGSTAARTLVKSKKRIALIEGRYFGGTNINTRDIPYSVTLDFAQSYYKVSRLPEFSHQDFSFNFPTIVAHQLKAIIESGGGNNQKLYSDAGIVCLHGYANFLDNHTIAIGEQKFTSNHFILATGSHLDTSSISGVEAVNYLTPETAIKIRRLPKAALIIGGGSTGCEIAEYYAKLGARVFLMESASRILPAEDPETSQAIADYFNTLNITILTNSKAIALEQDEASKRVIFQNDHTEKMVRIDCIVLATGSAPTTDYGLENAGVKLTKTGTIKVDKTFQTSAKNIYAIGDCINNTASTERANYEGKLLATNIINKTKNTPNYVGFARVTSTSPAIVSLGLNETELKRRKRKYQKSIVYLKDIPASKIYNSRYGFVKLIADRTNHIIGASIVAPNAAAMSGELALAIRHHLSAIELASTPHITNDFSYAIKLAAKKLAKKK